MNQFYSPNSDIHIIARGFMFSGDNIILCKTKGGKWNFLPGGHVENGESSKSALLRELNEELGLFNYKIGPFVGICENVFSLEENLLQHEINILFKVDVPSNFIPKTQEDHIEFVKIPINSIKKCNILPILLKDSLIKWLDDRKSFLIEI